MLSPVKIKKEETDIDNVTQIDISPERIKNDTTYVLTTSSGNHPFRCDQCPRTFKREVRLKCHKLVHKNKSVTVKQEVMEIDQVQNDIINFNDIKPDKRIGESCQYCGVVLAASSRELHLCTHPSFEVHETRECEVYDKNIKVKLEEMEIDDIKIIQGNDIIDPKDIKKEKPDTEDAGGVETCQYCGMAFATSSMESHLCNHLFKYNAQEACRENREYKSFAVRKSILAYKCNSCSRSFRLRKQLKYHKLIHKNDKKLKCKQCDDSFTNALQLRKHYKLAHTFSPLYPCKLCRAVCSSVKAIERHKGRHLRDPPVACEICDKQFLNVALCARHKEGAHEGRFQCEICSKYYLSNQSLKRHRERMHWGTATIECEACGYYTKYEKMMSLHKSRRCRGTPAERRYCNRRNFITFDESNSKPGGWFGCKLCDYKTGKDEWLAMHVVRVHEGVLHFKCGECGLGFMTQRLLELHLKGHMVTKYRCERCLKYYKSYVTLKRHLEYCEERKDGDSEKVCSTPIKPEPVAIDSGSKLLKEAI